MNASSGLIHVWQQGDGVTRFVALLLLAMSLASWVVMVPLRKKVRQVWVMRDLSSASTAESALQQFLISSMSF